MTTRIIIIAFGVGLGVLTVALPGQQNLMALIGGMIAGGPLGLMLAEKLRA